MDVGKQRVNPNPPCCPNTQHPHLRGSGRPSGRNLLSRGDAQPWGSCHRDPPSPKAPAAALLPSSEGRRRAAPGQQLCMDLMRLSRSSRGAFLHGVFPRPPSHLLQPYGDLLLTFWDRAHQVDISLAHFGTSRPQFFHHILLQMWQRFPGERKGAFQRNPERSLALTDLLLGGEEQGDTSKSFIPQKAAGMFLPLDVTAMPRAAACPEQGFPAPGGATTPYSLSLRLRERKPLLHHTPGGVLIKESVKNKSVLVRRAIPAPSSAPAPAAGWPAWVLARYATAGRGQTWHLPYAPQEQLKLQTLLQLFYRIGPCKSTHSRNQPLKRKKKK